jgi:Amt family ammonium transporter
VGLLADGTYGAGWNGVDGAVRGLFYGDPSQLLAQLVGGVTNIVAVGAMAYGAWKVTGLVVGGHRVSAEVEELGLDVPEMGVEAYPSTPEASTVIIINEPADSSLEPAARLATQPEPV